jgi:DNA-binding CsgD family transcriptional regulator/anti-sigma regulatory factor (Ser/Thr protein kinase)
VNLTPRYPTGDDLLRWTRMEWALEPHRAEAVGALRREIMDYLRRHAEPGSDLAGAEVVLAELLANAFQHAPGPAWVRASWSGERPRVEVHDLGPGFELDPKLAEPTLERGRGLFLVDTLADDLARFPKPKGGSKLVVTLPVRRRVVATHDPPRATASALPALDEASPDGTFGKEAFLRALVVELAQATEAQQGPDAAEAAVAQVGANVGGRMEEAYRAARGIVHRLSPAEIADLYVRLKRAIDGDFYVVSVDERRIVLGNRACPFGQVVERQPALCRMTSSVFGGIAARNHGHGAVVLEERIALGDPECRVVVWLGEHRPPDSDSAHHYLQPGAPEPPDPDVVEACRAAVRGEDFLYPEAVTAFLRDFLRRGESPSGAPKDPLTAREREIVKLIADSRTAREIAEQLVISEKTVERHRANVLLKLGLRDRVALTRYAIRRGLVEA